MKPTALGFYLLIAPYDRSSWQVAYFRQSGKYVGGHINLPTFEEAQKQRRKMFALHKRIAAKDAARNKRPA